MNISKLIFVAILIIVTGCEYNSDLKVDENKVDAFESEIKVVNYIFGEPEGMENKHRWSHLEGEEKEVARSDSREMTMKALRIHGKYASNLNSIESDVELISIVDKAKSVFESHKDDDALFLAEQMFAMKIQEYLFPNILTNGDLESLKVVPMSESELYVLREVTYRLVKNGNPNADLIELNLSLLKHYSSEEEISQWAAMAIENAERRFVNELTCSDCTSVSIQVDSRITSVKNGIQRLKSII